MNYIKNIVKSILAEEANWLTTAQGVLSLITGLIGLIGSGVGAFFAIKNFIKAAKTKSMNEIWSMIMSMADAAMKEAEASQKSGEDKKQMVLDAVKSGCKAANINIDAFIDQLSQYIDQTIDFVNKMSK